MPNTTGRRPLPALDGHDVEQHGGDDHGQRDGDAVGRGQAVEVPKPIDDGDAC